MAYTFEQSYYFRPYRGNSSFWLNRYGNGSIASHQKATLYTAAGSADQRLKVHKVSGGCQLLSDLNNAYGLNICLTVLDESKAKPPLCWNGSSSMEFKCGVPMRASRKSRHTAIS